MKTLKLRHTFACDEDWDSMPGSDRRKHCAQCDRHLVNFSQFTEKEAFKIAAEQLNDGEFCGVFEVRGNEILFKPEPVSRSLKTSVAAAALSLPLLMGCEEKAESPSAQGAQMAQTAQSSPNEPADLKVEEAEAQPKEVGAAAMPLDITKLIEETKVEGCELVDSAKLDGRGPEERYDLVQRSKLFEIYKDHTLAANLSRIEQIQAARIRRTGEERKRNPPKRQTEWVSERSKHAMMGIIVLER
jgi:hypothetical protein